MNSAVNVSTCSRCAAPLSPELPGALCPDCFGANLFADTLPDPGAAESAQTGVRRVGDYELGGELGRGGMGVVYRARQISLNRPAAVKLILTGPLASAVERQRFLAEAEAAAALDHPGIVAIYEAGEDGGQPFFAMQLIEGESLSARMRQAKGPLPPREAALLMLRTAQAVQHAHERGFLHRDLKPANILLSSDGLPHVTDFGLARRVDSDAHLTLTGAAIGTPSYMAPEQTDTRQPPTTAVDVYSLGAILYEMLSGHPPFRADSLAELFTAIREKEAASISSVRSEVDRDLDIVCRKCLEKEPARRYRSAQALADDLQHWLNGEPIAARAAGKTERLWRWCRRRPALASLIAACALLVVTLAIGSSIAAVKINASRASERTALAESRTQLHTALLSQAQAGRASGVAGARSRGLNALHRAAAIAGGVEARDEMIAHLALFDVEKVPDGPLIPWPEGVRQHPAHVTPAFDLSARCGPDGTLQFHAGLFGLETARWSPGNRLIDEVHFQPGGKVIAVQTHGPNVVLVDTRSQETLATLSDVWFSAWSPDGAVLVVIARGDLYSFHEGKTFARIGGVQGDSGGPVACNPRPGTSQAAIPGKNQIIIHDWSVNKRIASLDGTGKITSIAWQGDTVSAGTNDGRVLWWNLACNTRGGSTLHQGTVPKVLGIPGKNFVLTHSYDASSQLLDLPAGQVLARSKDVYPRQLHQNGSDLLFENNEAAGLARLAIPASCLLLDLPEPGTRSITMDFSPDGRWLAMQCEDSTMLHLCEPGTGRRFTVPLPFRARGAHFAASGERVLLPASDAVWALDLNLGPQGPLPSLTVRLGDLPGGDFGLAYLHPQRSRMAIGSNSSGVAVFDFDQAGGALLRVRPPSAPAAHRGGCSFSRDGAWLAMGSFHGEGLRLWQLPTEEEGPLLHSGNGHALFSPDGRRLLYTSQPAMTLFETGTWKPCGELRSSSHTSLPGRACWHPDSRHVAVVRESRVVDLWDVQSLTLKATLTPHTEMQLDYLTFSPDGRFLAVSTGVRRVLLWDLARLAGELAAAGTVFDFPVAPVSTGIPAPEFTPRLCFPPRPAGLDARHLNLDAHFNQMLQLQSSDEQSANVVPLAPGLHRLDGTDFDVRGLTRLAATQAWWRYPSRIPDIRVDRKCQRLHFLQSTVGGNHVPGQAIAVVRIHFSKGDSVSVPIRTGEETANWWDRDSVPRHATAAWTGANGKRDTLVLWKYTWANPRPDETIVGLTLESAMNEGALMLAGITAE